MLIYCVIKVNKKILSTLKIIVADNYQFFLGIVFSIFIWSVASYVPAYGLLFYMCLVCIIIFRIYDECTKIKTLNWGRFYYKLVTPITLLSLMLIFLYNYSWLSNLCSVTNSREVLIHSAKDKLKDSVVIPAYRNVNNLFFTMYIGSNSQKNFDSEFYIKYYGIHIIIDK